MPNTEPNTAVLDETIVYFSGRANIPGRPNRKRLRNWRDNGVEIRGGPQQRRGTIVKLEWAYLGGQVVTSLEACKRFQRRINGEEA